MPVRRGKAAYGPYYQWGSRGARYYYTAGDAASRAHALGLAEAQGRAAHAGSGTRDLFPSLAEIRAKQSRLRARTRARGGGFKETVAKHAKWAVPLGVASLSAAASLGARHLLSPSGRRAGSEREEMAHAFERTTRGRGGGFKETVAKHAKWAVPLGATALTAAAVLGARALAGSRRAETARQHAEMAEARRRGDAMRAQAAEAFADSLFPPARVRIPTNPFDDSDD